MRCSTGSADAGPSLAGASTASSVVLGTRFQELEAHIEALELAWLAKPPTLPADMLEELGERVMNQPQVNLCAAQPSSSSQQE